MSTNYYPMGGNAYDRITPVEYLRVVYAVDQGEIAGVTRGVCPTHNPDDCVVLHDGTNYVHMEKTMDSIVVTRWGANDPHEILSAMEQRFGWEWADEHDQRIIDIMAVPED
jgi:hypothetical protein